MRYSEIFFVHNIQLPDGASGNIIRAVPKTDPKDRWIAINREGDTVTVTWHLPGNEYSAFDVDGSRDYNWAIVGWATREAVAAPANPSKGSR